MIGVRVEHDPPVGFLSRLFAGKAALGVVGSHDAPALETTLPSIVAARPLVVWSVAGDNFWTFVGRRARPALGPELEAAGLDPDAIALAVAGRADKRDPPYIIWAVQFGDHPGQGLPRPAHALAMDIMQVDANQGEDWREVEIEMTSILLGNSQMVRQDRYQGGRPYVMFGPKALYSFITNDDAWASEVVRTLRAA